MWGQRRRATKKRGHTSDHEARQKMSALRRPLQAGSRSLNLVFLLGSLLGCSARPPHNSPPQPHSPPQQPKSAKESERPLTLSPELTRRFDAQLDQALQHKPQLLLVGETHDHPLHHQLQAQLIKRYRPKAVAFEMLNSAQQEAASTLFEHPPERWAERLKWAERGWPDFELYRPVFEAARDVGAVLIAAHPDRAQLQPLMLGQPLPQLLREALKLDEPLPPEQQRELEAELTAAHCGYAPPELLGPLVSAQRLKDAWMARSLLSSPQPVVLIVGRGHTQASRGIPWALERLSESAPSWRVLSLSAETPQQERHNTTSVQVEAHRLDDPCERFKGQLEKMKRTHQAPHSSERP
jgi:uncharacterized iron-regulated protein